MLKAGYIDQDLYHATNMGTPQGGILSPLLSNVYLNDFDWYVGRCYMEPHRQCKYKCNDTRRLKWSGITPKYNFRYADDWVILTSTKQEAFRLKKELAKYFQFRMKLELSDEKTYVTDLREGGIHFLGYIVKAERKRKTPDPATWSDYLVGKPLPDMERLTKKIHSLQNEIRRIGIFTQANTQAAQIQYVNSIIMGLAQYLQPSICSHAFHAIDRRVNYTALAVWKNLFPKRYNQIRPKASAAAAAIPEGQRGPQNRESKIWILVRPDGQRFTVINLLDWARQNYKLFEPTCTDSEKAAVRITKGFTAIASSMRGVKSRQRPVSTYKGWSLDELPSGKGKTMTNKQRIFCIQEVQHYTDRDAYVSDLAMSSIWGIQNDAPPISRLEALGNLYDAATRSVKDIAANAGLSQRGLAERFAIPYRTVENWCSDARECPLYTRLMMQEILGLL